MKAIAEGTLTCGVDIGARSIDVVLFDGSAVVVSLVVSTGHRPRENALEAYASLLDSAGVGRSDLAATFATGYGRNRFAPADGASSEILCHAAGVAHGFPDARCVVDIGGQDSKAIELGPDGRVVNFSMNDRCAAGTGRFIEMVAQILDVTVERAGRMALDGSETREINAMCAVFAETEIVGLLQNGAPPDAILRGVYRAVAKRTLSLMGGALLRRGEGQSSGDSAKATHPEGEIVFTGGVALNPGVVRALEAETGREVLVPESPQTTCALGAAIIASRGRAGRVP